jgi:peroxiredoxin
MTGIWLVAFGTQWVLLVLLGVVIVSLLRNVGTLAEAVQQLQGGGRDPMKLTVGEAVPELALTRLDGTPVNLASYQGTSLTLHLISPGCGPCHELLHSLATTGADSSASLIVSVGSAEATQALLSETGLRDTPVLLAESAALLAQWGIGSTPTTVELDRAGHFVRHTVGFTPPQQTSVPTTTQAEAVTA